MTQPLPKLDTTVELTTAQIYRPFPAPEPMNPITAEPQDYEPVPGVLLPGEKKPKGRPKGSKSKAKKARAKKAPAAKAPVETVTESPVPAIDTQRLVASAPAAPSWFRFVRLDNAVALLVALLIFSLGYFFAATVRFW